MNGESQISSGRSGKESEYLNDQADEKDKENNLNILQLLNRLVWLKRERVEIWNL
jgi:hypothetical protein